MLALTFATAAAADFDEAKNLFIAGKYEECLRACRAGEAESEREENWPMLQAQTLLAVGNYPEAEAVVSNGLRRYSSSIRLRFLGYETANASGNTNAAETRLDEINQLAGVRPWAYRNGPDLLALGRAALRLGVDPKIILERFFSAAEKAEPGLRDVPLAAGELALEKRDFALAAKRFQEALKKFPDDPDILWGLARAYEPNSRSKMLELVETALEKNEKHVPSLLLVVNHLIDAEEYEEAGKYLARALNVNPWRPEAWAYRAVIAHLRNDAKGETEARGKGLHYWKTNPLVDYLIGAKLSQNYRFTEGAAYQRRALASDTNYLPAQIQLAEDLLRLGDDEGWQLAAAVHKRDGYDVTAYNLVSLQGVMQKFTTLTNGDFILRMSRSEAELYGDRALALLTRAKSNLTARYGITLERPTVVEIFPDQKDFGVRTFGMPHNPGFLGVCFGRVVTANSPASQAGRAANWEAVLWHEFCHVVTLQMTKNKMPRWLSEGISVYEELQENAVWGQHMNPRYRAMILGEDLTPVAELSSAFMSPKSEFHVQFAYFESLLVVQFLVEKFGFEKLKAMLRDLGQGVNINESIPKHTAPLAQIEKDFAAFARAKAEALAPGLDFTEQRSARAAARPGQAEAGGLLNLPSGATNSLRKALQDALSQGRTNVAPHQAGPVGKTNAPNYWSLLDESRRLALQKDWAAAAVPLKKLIDLYPNQSGPNNAYAMLATVHRGFGTTNGEIAALEKWAALDNEAVDAYLRLMQFGETVGDWKSVAQNADRYLAVNPLVPQPWRSLAWAGESLGETNRAINAYQKILQLDPADPAAIHFRLARLLQAQDAVAAKRHVLQALEEAPRFRDAHKLLLELAQVKIDATNTLVRPTAPGSNK